MKKGLLSSSLAAMAAGVAAAFMDTLEEFQPTPTYNKQPGAGTMRRREREAMAAKNRKPIVQGPASRQVQRAAMRRTFKDLRSERKKYAMKTQKCGGSATIREV